MCVIIHKPAGVEVDEHTLWQCNIHNPDGCGYVASTPKGMVFMRKGFRDDSALLLALAEDCAKLGVHRDELEMILHFRIATAGVVNVVNTHPYIIHGEHINLNQVYDIPHQVLAHNGHVMIPDVFGVESSKLKTYSDSYLLARDVLSHMSTSLRFRVLNKLGRSNKFAVMMPSGKVKRFGSWDYEDKMWFSNTFWQYSYRKYSTTYGDRYWNKGVSTKLTKKSKDSNSVTYTTKKTGEVNYDKPDTTCHHGQTFLDGNDHILCEDCGGNLSLYCLHEYIYGEYGEKDDHAGTCAICYEQVGVPSHDPDKCEHPRIAWTDGGNGVYYKECPDCFDTLQVACQDDWETKQIKDSL